MEHYNEFVDVKDKILALIHHFSFLTKLKPYELEEEYHEEERKGSHLIGLISIVMEHLDHKAETAMKSM